MTRNRPVPSLSLQDTAFARSLVVHEDEHLIAFNKPSGLAVQTRGNRGPCLENLLPAFAKSNGKLPRLVHRLDAGTSGLILAARTKPAAAHLSEQFAKRHVRKTYFAVARGELPMEEAGTIDQPLLKCIGQRGTPPMVPSNAEGAQSARTYWRILSRSGQTALFELQPKTGRMHQLRVHLAHLGCPILGDTLYGQGKTAASRLMLHAARLSLTHPNTTPFMLSAELPDEVATVALTLGLVLPDEPA